MHYPTWTDKLKRFGIIEFKSSSSVITKEPYDAFMNVLNEVSKKTLDAMLGHVGLVARCSGAETWVTKDRLVEMVANKWDDLMQRGGYAPLPPPSLVVASSSSPPTRDFVPFSGKAMKLASDEETKVVKIDEEKRMRSKDTSFNCPHCNCKLLFQNSIEINPKGVKCRCNGCSFKLSRNDKTMNVSRDDNGEIKLDSEDHSISFSFNSITTPPQNEEQRKYEMIQDVMGTPRSKPFLRVEGLD